MDTCKAAVLVSLVTSSLNKALILVSSEEYPRSYLYVI